MRMFSLMTTVAAVAFMETVETVVINTSNGPVRVNKSDYDADQAEGGEKSMKLHKTETADQPDPLSVASVPSPPAGAIIPPAPSAPSFIDAQAPIIPAPNARLVMKEGRKFFVVDMTGAKVKDVNGIDEAGYGTEQAAVDAIAEAARLAPPAQPPAPTV